MAITDNYLLDFFVQVALWPFSLTTPSLDRYIGLPYFVLGKCYLFVNTSWKDNKLPAHTHRPSKAEDLLETGHFHLANGKLWSALPANATKKMFRISFIRTWYHIIIAASIVLLKILTTQQFKSF